jgi:uncharacterized membrane protein
MGNPIDLRPADCANAATMHEVANESAIPVKPSAARPRLDAVDLLRGWIMIFMALDHVRDYFHTDALRGIDPTDPAQTYPALFFTRWITHFCAPIFFFLAGTGAFLSLGRGKTKGDLSYFLVTRGLWLVLLELTVVRFGWTFSIDPRDAFGQVIWALGWSMVVLAALIHLPMPALTGFAIAVIAGHNLLDGRKPADFGSFAWLWTILHVQAPFEYAPGWSFFVVYPLVPWFAGMAAGFAFGNILRRDRPERRRIVLRLGLGLTAAFVILRAINLYGDPQPWVPQRNAVYTLLSFLNCSKYPPSLLFLLMTIGPALIVLALVDRELGKWSRPIITFGRVPLFFYLLHLPLIHGLAVLSGYLQHRYVAGGWFGPPWPGAPVPHPSGYRYELPGVYAVWLLVVVLLYPLSRWFAELKQRRREAWLSYL